MTTVTQVQLVPPAQIAGTDTVAWFVAGPLQTARIGRAIFCNTSGNATTITAGISLGGALAANTTFISARPIAPGETYVSPELAGAVIPQGSAIRAFAGTGAEVTFSVSGLTIV